jgi:hypothetical protein
VSECLVAADSLAEFRVFASRTGAPTALHLPTRNLLHSAVDPVREARDIVAADLRPDCETIVIVGGGLGYVPEQAMTMCPNARITVIEPDAALLQLARLHRPDAPYFTSRMQIIVASTPTELSCATRDLPRSASMMISPYLLRIAAHTDHWMSGFLRIARSELASRAVYDNLVRDHERLNLAILSALPSALDVVFDADLPIIVVGAGPSLDACLAAIHEHRHHCLVVAASGAVPSLLNSGIVPDWTVALEAKATVIGDVDQLPRASRTIVFPATNPEILTRSDLTLWSAGIPGRGCLETRGGSSAIPALDFALRASRQSILLVGLDLGHQSGSYSAGANRTSDESTLLQTVPPKFLSMRAGLERVIDSHSDRAATIYHVLDAGVPLRQTRLLTTRALGDVFRSSTLKEVLHA